MYRSYAKPPSPGNHVPTPAVGLCFYAAENCLLTYTMLFTASLTALPFQSQGTSDRDYFVPDCARNDLRVSEIQNFRFWGAIPQTPLYSWHASHAAAPP